MPTTTAAPQRAFIAEIVGSLVHSCVDRFNRRSFSTVKKELAWPYFDHTIYRRSCIIDRGCSEVEKLMMLDRVLPIPASLLSACVWWRHPNNAPSNLFTITHTVGLWSRSRGDA